MPPQTNLLTLLLRRSSTPSKRSTLTSSRTTTAAALSTSTRLHASSGEPTPKSGSGYPNDTHVTNKSHDLDPQAQGKADAQRYVVLSGCPQMGELGKGLLKC
jgi:hypothetical protein